jgi:hypothetical protein
MFDALLHANWSCNDKKRWIATAELGTTSWKVYVPKPAPGRVELVELIEGSGRRVLAGFDFPIGLPVAFGRQIGFDGFLKALSEFGRGDWTDFFSVADTPLEIALRRPFYPNTSRRGHKQAHMFGPLGISAIDELRRECERKTVIRPAACPIFWTLGGNQVGKAAIDGWQHVVRPALDRGTRLWPFHGRLEELSQKAGSVLCETYPREAYGHLGVVFGPRQSKRRQEDRQVAAEPITRWAAEHHLEFTADAKQELLGGFGSNESGEDPFDALDS